MLKRWNVLYQIGTNPAQVSVCLTEGDLRAMLGIKNEVPAEKIRLIKVLRKK